MYIGNSSTDKTGSMPKGSNNMIWDLVPCSADHTHDSDSRYMFTIPVRPTDFPRFPDNSDTFLKRADHCNINRLDNRRTATWDICNIPSYAPNRVNDCLLAMGWKHVNQYRVRLCRSQMAADYRAPRRRSPRCAPTLSYLQQPKRYKTNPPRKVKSPIHK